VYEGMLVLAFQLKHCFGREEMMLGQRDDCAYESDYNFGSSGLMVSSCFFVRRFKRVERFTFVYQVLIIENCGV
jgi:hypothetical protein